MRNHYKLWSPKRGSSGPPAAAWPDAVCCRAPGRTVSTIRRGADYAQGLEQCGMGVAGCTRSSRSARRSDCCRALAGRLRRERCVQLPHLVRHRRRPHCAGHGRARLSPTHGSSSAAVSADPPPPDRARPLHRPRRQPDLKTHEPCRSSAASPLGSRTRTERSCDDGRESDAVQSAGGRLIGTKVEHLAARSLDLAIWKAAVRRRTGRGRTAAVELRCMPGLFSQDDPSERNALVSAKRADHSPRDHARRPTLTPRA